MNPNHEVAEEVLTALDKLGMSADAADEDEDD